MNACGSLKSIAKLDLDYLINKPKQWTNALYNASFCINIDNEVSAACTLNHSFQEKKNVQHARISLPACYIDRLNEAARIKFWLIRRSEM